MVATSVANSAVAGGGVGGGSLLLLGDAANAACLPGDLSTECIGVYKVPVDDRVLPFVSTPEALQRFAPDINYVPPIPSPTSLAQAWDILRAQRLAAEDIQKVVAGGRLEEAGIKVLNLVPKVTSSGRLLMSTIEEQNQKNRIIAYAAANAAANVAGGGGGGGNNNNNNNNNAIEELRWSKLEQQFEILLASWGECDVTIGQGLRGEMGVSAVAQLQILDSLKDATVALDDFMASAAVSAKVIISS